jgi:hypothetical protein
VIGCATSVYSVGITHDTIGPGFGSVGEEVPAASVGREQSIAWRGGVVYRYSVPSEICFVGSEGGTVYKMTNALADLDALESVSELEGYAPESVGLIELNLEF